MDKILSQNFSSSNSIHYNCALCKLRTEVISEEVFYNKIFTADISNFISNLITENKLNSSFNNNNIHHYFKLHCIKFSFIDFNKIEVFEYYKGGFDTKCNKSGVGISVLSNHSIYYGMYKNNNKHGFGILLNPDTINGNTYNYYYGSFINDNITGKGVLCVKNNFIFQGQFVNSIKSGKGKEIYPDGSVYEGNFISNEKNGYGKYIYSEEKAVYEGRFKDGKFSGKGKIKWKDGRRYEGEFVNGTIEGKGIFSWPNGDIYQGEYLRGMKNGNGIMEMKDGRKIKGCWSHNQLQGNCVLISVSGEKYFGLFRFGKLIFMNNKKNKKNENCDKVEISNQNNV